MQGDATLAREFEMRQQRFARECQLPTLEGTIDIYSERQACLLASGSRWHPRPAFQSYASYTERLQAANAGHVRGPGAPDHIWFRIEPLNDRLPALDDGHSWKTLINDYSLATFNGDVARLDRRTPRPPPLRETEVHSGTHVVGEVVELPLTPGPMLAEIDLRHALPGRVLAALFRSPIVAIELTLEDGAVRAFRFVPKMGRSSTVISPLVESTQDFVRLFGPGDSPPSKRVRSLRLLVTSTGDIFWSDHFGLVLRRLDVAGHQ
jgi:hypothetical protein